MELVRERTEALCGHKPSDSALEAFLKSRQGAATEVNPSPRVTRVVVQPVSTPPAVPVPRPVPDPQEQPTPSGRNRWRLGDLSGVERNGNDALAAVLTALFTKYPTRQETMAAAVRTRGRNNIARVVEEIYPNKPEIAVRNHRQLPDGWFVGTNESSATKTRIVSQAAAAVGLTMGRDIEFEV